MRNQKSSKFESVIRADVLVLLGAIGCLFLFVLISATGCTDDGTNAKPDEDANSGAYTTTASSSQYGGSKADSDSDHSGSDHSDAAHNNSGHSSSAVSHSADSNSNHSDSGHSNRGDSEQLNSSNLELALAAAQEEAADESGGVLKGASDLYEKAKTSGGESAELASKWVQEKWNDTAEAGGATAEDTMEWASEMYESLKEQGLTTAGSTKEWVSSDWNKMGAWEYKVVRINDTSPQGAENQLNELGGGRWECFHVSESDTGPIMYFKKPAKSYLKHVPLRDVMKLIPMMNSGEE